MSARTFENNLRVLFYWTLTLRRDYGHFCQIWGDFKEFFISFQTTLQALVSTLLVFFLNGKQYVIDHL